MANLPVFKTIEEKRSAFNYQQANSLDEVLKILNSATNTNSQIYFRGQASGSWKIYSSLQREWITKDLTKAYPNGYKDFISQLLSFAKNNYELYFQKNCPILTDIGILATGQHYGMPTPFIDWTSDFNIALYFSSLGNEYCTDIKTENYFSVYWLSVEVCSRPGEQELTRFSELLKQHRDSEIRKDIEKKFGAIPGTEIKSVTKFEFWSDILLWMEASDDQWMKIANPRSNSQKGAFLYSPEAQNSLDNIFDGISETDFSKSSEKEHDLFFSKINCLDIHKSVLPKLRKYLTEKHINKKNLGLNDETWGAQLYLEFRAS